LPAKRYLWLAVLSVVQTCALAADAGRWTLALDLGENHVEGFPLSWTDRQVQLLSRDGQVLDFSPNQARNARKAAPTFQGYSSAEMRSQLSRELGPSFDVSGTGHYLVAHAKGQRDVWAPRFEELYRSLVHYFTLRGISLNEPEFPLVAIIWKNQADFLRYAEKTGARIGPNVLGFYSPKTNRISLYDTSGTGAGKAWQQNADVIIHEATHQTSFNTGLHRRFADNPRWLVEGLGTMFEARGVWNSRQYQKQSDRLNMGRLMSYRHLESDPKAGAILQLIGNDRMFETNVDRAYALAWALTFFLCETQPQRYGEYLKLIAKRPAFVEYSSADRVKDFTKIFGDIGLLEGYFRRFMNELRT
jgi:hypothetical protein